MCSYKYTSSTDILKLILSECKREEYPYIYSIKIKYFEKQAKTINGTSMEVIKTKSILMVSHIDSIIKKIPDTLNTPLIFSRLIVVKTRTQLLNLEVNKAHFDSVRLQDYFKEMNISVRNLFIQINEKFEKDAIDLQRIDTEKKELVLQKEFLEAVYKAELEDQNNK